MLERGDVVGGGGWGVTANAARDAVTPHSPLPTRFARFAIRFGVVSLRFCSSPPATSPPSTSSLPCRRRSRTTRRPTRRPGTRAVDIGWRDFFADPRLEALIEAALVHNRDLAVSVARIEEARGFYRIQGAERYPAPVDRGGGVAEPQRPQRGGHPERQRRDDRSRVDQRRGEPVRARLLGTRARPHGVGARRLPRHRPGAARVPSLAHPGRRLDVPRVDRDGGADPARRHHGAEPARRSANHAGALSRRAHLGARPAPGRVAAGAGGGLAGRAAADAGAAEQPAAAAGRRAGGGPTARTAPAHAADHLHGARGGAALGAAPRAAGRARGGGAAPLARRRASARRARRSFRRSRSPAYSASRRAR